MLTKVIVIDQDFIELLIFQEEFPEASVLFCQFHVIKHLYKVVSDVDVTKERRDDLRKVLHDIVYSQSLEEYDKLLGNPTFDKCFGDQCSHMWVSYQRDQCEHFGNTTNNRLECSHSKLRYLMSRASSLSEMFDGIRTFVHCISSESTHHAFTEEFTSTSTFML